MIYSVNKKNMFYICGKYKNGFLMKTVKLITCNDAMKAHILQGALENEGIESILHNETSLPYIRVV